MARTTIAGFGGAFDSGDATNDAAVLSWSGTQAIDANKVEPPFGTKWRRTVLGAGEFTGSLTANVEYDVAASQPFDPSDATDWASMTGLTIVLTAFTGCTYTFTGCLFNCTTTAVNGGVATFTADFANTSNDLAIVWDVGV